MGFDSLVNRGDYFSAHYLAEVLPKDLKKKDGLFARWNEQEKAGRLTPRKGLRALAKPYFADRPYFADLPHQASTAERLSDGAEHSVQDQPRLVHLGPDSPPRRRRSRDELRAGLRRGDLPRRPGPVGGRRRRGPPAHRVLSAGLAENDSLRYRAGYPVLCDYEARIWFDADGRKIAGNHNTYGYGQTRQHFEQLTAHLDPETNGPVPRGTPRRSTRPTGRPSTATPTPPSPSASATPTASRWPHEPKKRTGEADDGGRGVEAEPLTQHLTTTFTLADQAVREALKRFLNHSAGPSRR
ncbi:hypothetical protein [Sphaerimonospora thailandensis]|uniref:Uncharacterized protein n=1 Tax=Sphaerimonospora thailandensis TaxID=795644 RepID=A0A8J3R8J8_9ACTN|nr:hypothetical protein [Sphaerimonospora thailandensis]GIH68008.1 hypothetical protein Mth01_02610 [Sphaerimonospora thailandensis]